MRILHVVPALAERSGGPTRAVLGLARQICLLGHQAVIYTTDVDGQQPLLTWRPTVSHVAERGPTSVDGVPVLYFKTIFPSRWVTSPAMARALRSHTSEFDVIHIHSLFMFSTLAAAHYARKHRVPYIVRPHGSLDPFLRRRGRLKKFIYTGLIEKRNLDRATAIHYTSRDERDLAAPVGIKAPSVVVPLGVNLEEFNPLPAAALSAAGIQKREGRTWFSSLGGCTLRRVWTFCCSRSEKWLPNCPMRIWWSPVLMMLASLRR